MKDNKDKESWFSNFINNYKTNDSFKAFVKLTGYFVFIFILMLMISLLNVNEPTIPESQTTTTTTASSAKKTVRDLVEDLYKIEKNFIITIKNGDEEYLIEMKNNDKSISGTISKETKVSRFIIEDEKIYELVMKDKKENPELFKDLELKYIKPRELAHILLSNKIIKHENENEIVLSYDLKDEKIEVAINNEVISKVSIKNDETSYLIEIR